MIGALKQLRIWRRIYSDQGHVGELNVLVCVRNGQPSEVLDFSASSDFFVKKLRQLLVRDVAACTNQTYFDIA